MIDRATNQLAQSNRADIFRLQEQLADLQRSFDEYVASSTAAILELKQRSAGK